MARKRTLATDAAQRSRRDANRSETGPSVKALQAARGSALRGRCRGFSQRIVLCVVVVNKSNDGSLLRCKWPASSTAGPVSKIGAWSTAERNPNAGRGTKRGPTAGSHAQSGTVNYDHADPLRRISTRREHGRRSNGGATERRFLPPRAATPYTTGRDSPGKDSVRCVLRGETRRRSPPSATSRPSPNSEASLPAKTGSAALHALPASSGGKGPQSTALSCTFCHEAPIENLRRSRRTPSATKRRMAIVRFPVVSAQVGTQNDAGAQNRTGRQRYHKPLLEQALVRGTQSNPFDRNPTRRDVSAREALSPVGAAEPSHWASGLPKSSRCSKLETDGLLGTGVRLSGNTRLIPAVILPFCRSLSIQLSKISPAPRTKRTARRGRVNGQPRRRNKKRAGLGGAGRTRRDRTRE